MERVARSRVLSTVFVFALAMSLPVTASAHVKWFSNFSFADRPRTWQEALTATTWALMALSMLALGVLVFLERRNNKLALAECCFEAEGLRTTVVVKPPR
jgi:hypothetical protein